MKIFEKINICDILREHIQTLSNVTTKKHEIGDLFLFGFFPMLITGIILYLKLFLSKDFVDILCTCLSIFVGLFFNVILLIFDLVSKSEKSSPKCILLRELLINICFEIFISVFCIVFALISLADNCLIKYIFNGLTLFLTSLFLVTLIMILKRTFDVFIKEIDGSDTYTSKY